MVVPHWPHGRHHRSNSADAWMGRLMHLFGDLFGGWFLTIYIRLTSNWGCFFLVPPRAWIAGVESIPSIYMSEVSEVRTGSFPFSSGLFCLSFPSTSILVNRGLVMLDHIEKNDCLFNFHQKWGEGALTTYESCLFLITIVYRSIDLQLLV